MCELNTRTHHVLSDPHATDDCEVIVGHLSLGLNSQFASTKKARYVQLDNYHVT